MVIHLISFRSIAHHFIGLSFKTTNFIPPDIVHPIFFSNFILEVYMQPVPVPGIINFLNVLKSKNVFKICM